MRNGVMARAARFVGSGWRWIKLWIGSFFPSLTPSKDEIAAWPRLIRSTVST